MRDRVIFERNMTGSFMKIEPGPDISELDEKILNRNQIKGLLPVDLCILDGRKQYWYNITGCLSLESYLSLHAVDEELLTLLICSLADQVERMDHYLLDGNCLELSPETIFLRGGSEVRFALIPEAGQSLMDRLRGLMEYLLTRVDHSNQKMVEMTYGLYELVSGEDSTIAGLKAYVCRQVRGQDRGQKAGAALLEYGGENDEDKDYEGRDIADKLKASKEEDYKEEVYKEDDGSGSRMMDMAGDLFGETIMPRGDKAGIRYKPHLPEWKVKENPPGYKGFFARIVQAFREEFIQDYDADMMMIIEPEEEAPVPVAISNPTVCLSADQQGVEGLLVCEDGEYGNIRVESGSKVIGSGGASEITIPKDTISAVHARITKDASGYFLEDLNSTNGTYVNGEILNYLEKRMLKKGDLIRFADVRYRFV